MKTVVAVGRVRVAPLSGAFGRIVRFISMGLFAFALLLERQPLHASPQLLPGVYGYGLDRATNPAGFAANAEIFHVTKLDDNGSNANPPAESLRWAITKRNKTPEGVLIPRIVVFDLSGVIQLKGNLTIADGNITIAGQTAPSPGISLHGVPFAVMASNVLVQHLRVRAGDNWLPGPDTHDRDTVRVANPSVPVNNVVFDHCTFAWSLDETASLWYAWDSVTFYRCLFAEPLKTAIHIDEHHLPGNDPVDVEGLTPPDGVTTSTPSDTRAVSGKHMLVDFTDDGQVADFTITMIENTSSDARNNLHFVVAGITGPDRGKFRVEVRRDPNDTDPVQSGDFDEYVPGGQEKLTSFVTEVNGSGFAVPDDETPLYIRVISQGTSGSSRQVSLDVFSISQPHAMGPLFGGGGDTGGGRVAMIGSVIADVMERGPWIGSKHFVFANNVLYDRKSKFLMIGANNWEYKINTAVIGNTFIEGSALTTTTNEPIHLEVVPNGGIALFETDNDYNKGGGGTANMVDPDLTPFLGPDTTDQGNGMAGFLPLPKLYGYEAAMYFAGARPDDRDDFENRIFSEITQGATIPAFGSRPGSLKNSVAEAGGWPTYPQNAANWNPPIPSVATANLDDDGDGYSNIEEWLRTLSAQVEGTLPANGGSAVFDNFDDNNANGWVAWGGNWSVVADGTPVFNQSDANAVAPFATLGQNWDDQSITADAKVLAFGQANSWFGLFARFVNPSNYYYAKITNTTAEIKRIVGGVFEPLTTHAFTGTPGTWHTVQFQVIGTQLKLLIDGVEMGSVTDNALTVGKAGLLMYRSNVEYDNVSTDPAP